ncbi:thiaminase II [Pueribacillus theae]|uniref:Aminopyrimidine aminohydrolase n=1 Tax=Pueribacillus theae TaxID=2171751 RepID=A0A2U1K6J8_9BACI|nr:thiaminase II [Pueribacillus theae]PWA12834.1 thiaminase II [Pueribacillus theae]
MRFTEELRQATKDSWEQSLNHPFVLGIVNGDLPLETFKYYILQDIYYLKHFGKVHAMAAAQADDFQVSAMLAEKAKLTAQAELTVHQEHANLLNITDEEMKNFKPAPTAYAYTSHLYRAALSGSLAQTVAAMLPCYWLYADIGKKNMNAKPNEQIYQNWLHTYASDWFQTSTEEQIDLMDQLAQDASGKEKEKIKEQFVIAKEYELAFWEMAYTKETWLSKKQSKQSTLK